MQRWQQVWSVQSAFGLALIAGVASAQPSSKPAEDAQHDRATRLFRQARELRAEGRFSLACLKFQESLDLVRSPGTLLNLGGCRKGEGDLLAAIEVFQAATTEAQSRPDSHKRELWLKAAASELATLESRIAHLALRQPGGERLPSSWEARIDGVTVTATGGVGVRQNPGQHLLEVVARDRQPFSRSFELTDGEVLRVEVSLQLATPKLDPAPQLDPAPTPAPQSVEPAVGPQAMTVTDTPTASPWAVSLTVLGGVGVVGGSTAGVISWLQTRNLEEQCEDPCTDSDGLNQARRWADIANVLVGSGLALGAIGGLWWLLGDETPPDSEARRRLTSEQALAQARGIESLKLGGGCLNRQTCALELTGTF